MLSLGNEKHERFRLFLIFKKDLIEITYLDRLPLVEREYDQASLYLVNQTL